MKKMNKKGFTLIEMLVVIAIIAILVAIVIPVVGNATEKAKEAKDAARIRSVGCELTSAKLPDAGTYTITLKADGTYGVTTATTTTPSTTAPNTPSE